VKIKIASNVSEFLDEVDGLRTKWEKESHQMLWFRGEDRIYRKALHPRLSRKGIGISEALDYEDSLFAEFRRYGGKFTEVDPPDSCEWYTLMQHYGGPTRLLDWSEGALIALHFAVKQPESKGPAAVYVLDPGWLKELHHPGRLEEFLPLGHRNPPPAKPVVVESQHFIRRVAAQRSGFVVLDKESGWLRSHLNKKDSRIRRIRIPESSFRNVRAELRSCGVTESVIFPDLDGLSREINDLWELMRDR